MTITTDEKIKIMEMAIELADKYREGVGFHYKNLIDLIVNYDPYDPENKIKKESQ